MAASLPVYSRLCPAENARRTVGEINGLDADESGRNRDFDEIRDILNDIREKLDETGEPERTSDEIRDEIRKHLDEMHQCFPTEYFFSFSYDKITTRLVEKVYDELMASYTTLDGKLNVVVFSNGGDADSAFNLSVLFRKFAPAGLIFTIPRWAKSAGTLLALSGDEVHMTDVAELGPLDPQIRHFDLARRHDERISPLDLKYTLELIRQEFANGDQDLAKGLMKRLQFPMTLGRIIKSPELSEQYLMRNLLMGMFNADDEDEVEKARGIAHRLVYGYPDHRYSILAGEAEEMGLSVSVISERRFEMVWKLHKLQRELYLVE